MGRIIHVLRRLYCRDSWKTFNSASLHHAVARTAPRLSTRGQSVLPQQTMKFFWLLKERCAHSKPLRSILRWLCWFKSSGSVLCLVPQVQWRRQWLFSPANQWSAEFTRHVLVTVRLAWNLGWGGTKKKYQVLYPLENPPNVSRTEPYCAVPCSGKAP